MASTEDIWNNALELLSNSGLGSAVIEQDAKALASAIEKTREVLTQKLADEMRADKWPDTDPRTHLEDLVSDLTMSAIERLMSDGVDEDEAQRTVGEFFDAHVLAGRGEDEIVDNAADRLSDDLSYTRDTASYFGHGHDDF